MTLAPSATNLFQLSGSDSVLEAFERIQIAASQITAERMISAARSANLLLQDWANRGVTLYTVEQATPIALVQGTATYTLPTNCVQMLDTYYSYPNGDGTYTDRLILPMTRTEYAMIPEKSIQAPPNRYWFQRTATPQVTTWQVFDGSQTGALLNYFYMRQMYDFAPSGSQTPDILNRFAEAFVTDLTARLAEKFAPAQWQTKDMMAKGAWDRAVAEDREQGPLTIKPNFSRYTRGG